MRYVIKDPLYKFQSAFDTETGVYIRSGILNEQGHDTGIDPFMASYPHLIDVGVMGHCRSTLQHVNFRLCSFATGSWFSLLDLDLGSSVISHGIPHKSTGKIDKSFVMPL